MDMSTALVIGEALTDVVSTAGEDIEYLGGSPYNVSINLGRLSDKVLLLTSIGGNPRGVGMRRRLDESNVRLEPESLQDGATSTAQTRIGENGSATSPSTSRGISPSGHRLAKPLLLMPDR